MSVYGYCPRCGAPGAMRERRPDGNDRCENAHSYPSRDAVKTPPAGAGEAVAEVCAGWTLRWVGAQPLAELLREHPTVRIGTKLYAAPTPLPEAVRAFANPLDVYAVNFLDGWLQDESEEVRRNWKTVKDAALRAIGGES